MVLALICFGRLYWVTHTPEPAKVADVRLISAAASDAGAGR